MAETSQKSILQESKKRQHKYKRWWIILLVLALMGGGYAWFATSQNTSLVEVEPQIVSPTRGDLANSIESDGTIINPNIAGLSFFINGTLKTIHVQEGDRVDAGTVLAELDTRDLDLNLRSAESSLQIAYANYQAKSAMLTDTQLRELEISLQSQQDELDSISLGVDQDLQQSLDLGVVQLETVFPSLDTALDTVDSFLLEDVDTSSNADILSVTYNSVGENKAKNMYQMARTNLNQLREEYLSQNNLSDSDISNYLRKCQTLAQSVQDLMDQMMELMRTAHATAAVSQTRIDAARNELSSTNSKVLSEINSLTSAIQRIESAYLSQQSKVISAENSIKKLQTQIETTQDSVEEKEISKQTSLSVLSAQITQAKIKVEQAQYNLEQAQLVAPISGEVIEVNGNEGETIKTDSTSSDTAFIKILSDSNFTTEVYVEEIDIAQIKKGQKVIITLDAVPDMELEGTVTFISSTATTSNSGVVTYLVRVEITDDQDAPIKEGMTTYVEFLTEEATGVILVPSEAVMQRGEHAFVILENGEKRPVEVGITDGSMTEIVSGLAESEKILVGGATAGSTGAKNGGAREMSEAMLERMREAGLTDDEIEKAKSGEMTDAMKEKMKAAMGDEPGGGGMHGMGGGAPR